MAQIFISYRREGGEALGRLIYEKLTNRGYSVFFDTESMQSEVFSERIYDEIEQCGDFILILPKGGLDRCIENEKDWVRLEISYALKLKKHIIPIIMRDFTFPQNLPDDIKDVSTYHGVPFESMDFFDARIDRICDFLLAKPTYRAKRSHIKLQSVFFQGFLIKIGSLFRKVRTILRTIIKALWKLRLIRYAVLFLLAVLVFSYAVDIHRDIKNVNVEQWIRPKYLFTHNAYTQTFAISDDNTHFAINNGDGRIFLYQTLGNADATSTVGTLETSFVDKKVSLWYSDDRNYCYVVCDDRMEQFNTHTEAKTGSYVFPDYDEDSLLVALSSNEDSMQGIIKIIWADRDGLLTKCSLYDNNDTISVTASFDITGYTFLGTAANMQYFIFINNHQEMKIIDTKNQCVIENTLEILADECCGKIDDSFYTTATFDKTRRYFMYTIRKDNGLYDVIIKDMQTGVDIFSRSYFNLQYFTFDENGKFVIFFDKILDQGILSKELHRVNYLKSAEAEEVLLSHDDFTRILNNEEWYSIPHEVHLFDQSNTLLLAYDNRLHLIDLDTKLRTASCNDLLDDGDAITFYSLFELDNNTIVAIYSLQDGTISDYSIFRDFWNAYELSAVRFSFEKEGNDIIIQEDAYASDKEPNNLFMLILSALGLLIFIYVGRKKDKQY